MLSIKGSFLQIVMMDKSFWYIVFSPLKRILVVKENGKLLFSLNVLFFHLWQMIPYFLFDIYYM